MKILLPLLSKKENEEDFIERISKEADEIILLLVIDSGDMAGMFGYATTEIRQGNKMIEELTKVLKRKKKKVDDIVEWGPTVQKIVNISKIRNVDKIVLKNQNNHWFNTLIGDLKKSKIKFDVI